MGRFIPPFERAFNNLGVVAPGAKLFFYEPGTTTKKTTYSDAARTIENTNPVIADAGGRFGNVFLTGPYKVVLAPATDSDPPTSPIWTTEEAGDTGAIHVADYGITGASGADETAKFLAAVAAARTADLPLDLGSGTIKLSTVAAEINLGNLASSATYIPEVRGNATLDLNGSSYADEMFAIRGKKDLILSGITLTEGQSTITGYSGSLAQGDEVMVTSIEPTPNTFRNNYCQASRHTIDKVSSAVATIKPEIDFNYVTSKTLRLWEQSWTLLNGVGAVTDGAAFTVSPVNETTVSLAVTIGGTATVYVETRGNALEPWVPVPENNGRWTATATVNVTAKKQLRARVGAWTSGAVTVTASRPRKTLLSAVTSAVTGDTRSVYRNGNTTIRDTLLVETSGISGDTVIIEGRDIVSGAYTTLATITTNTVTAITARQFVRARVSSFSAGTITATIYLAAQPNSYSYVSPGIGVLGNTGTLTVAGLDGANPATVKILGRTALRTTLTNGSNALTVTAGIGELSNGDEVVGLGIPDGTTISGKVDNGNGTGTATLSANATADVTSVVTWRRVSTVTSNGATSITLAAYHRVLVTGMGAAATIQDITVTLAVTYPGAYVWKVTRPRFKWGDGITVKGTPGAGKLGLLCHLADIDIGGRWDHWGYLAVNAVSSIGVIHGSDGDSWYQGTPASYAFLGGNLSEITFRACNVYNARHAIATGGGGVETFQQSGGTAAADAQSSPAYPGDYVVDGGHLHSTNAQAVWWLVGSSDPDDTGEAGAVDAHGNVRSLSIGGGANIQGGIVSNARRTTVGSDVVVSHKTFPGFYCGSDNDSIEWGDHVVNCATRTHGPIDLATFNSSSLCMFGRARSLSGSPVLEGTFSTTSANTGPIVIGGELAEIDLDPFVRAQHSGSTPYATADLRSTIRAWNNLRIAGRHRRARFYAEAWDEGLTATVSGMIVQAEFFSAIQLLGGAGEGWAHVRALGIAARNAPNAGFYVNGAKRVVASGDLSDNGRDAGAATTIRAAVRMDAVKQLELKPSDLSSPAAIQRYALYVGNATGFTTLANMRGCNVRGNQTAAVGNTGTLTWQYRKDNPGDLIGSKTHDWADLASGAVPASTTVTVTGLAAGDPCEVWMSVDLLGTFLWAVGTATDTATVYQRNDTGSNQNVGSGTLTVVGSKRS